MDLDLIFDAIAELVMYFVSCPILNKICMICCTILFIVVAHFIIKGLFKIILELLKFAFEIFKFALSVSIIGAGIYVVIMILIWFAENV